MSGKSSALQRLFTEVWVGNNGKSVFDRIYIFRADLSNGRLLRAPFTAEVAHNEHGPWA